MADSTAGELATADTGETGKRLRGFIASVLPAAILLVVIIVLWSVLSDAGIIPNYILPTPGAIGHEFTANSRVLIKHASATILEALSGFLIGNIVAILMSSLLTMNGWLKDAFFPFALLSRAIPIVVFTPVAIVMLGRGLPPILAIVSFSVYFPTFLNMMRGLNSVDADYEELLHTLSATPLQRLRLIQFPASMPSSPSGSAPLRASAISWSTPLSISDCPPCGRQSSLPPASRWCSSGSSPCWSACCGAGLARPRRIEAMADLTTDATTLEAETATEGPVAFRKPLLQPGQLRKITLPALVLIVVLAGWQYATVGGHISKIILASPTDILAVFTQADGLQILQNAGYTITEALTGYAIGNTLGLLVAILFIHSDLARRTIYPIAIGAESIPFVAVVPVLILWLGNGMEPKMVITSFLSFFPMLINAFRGLRSADSEVNELLYTLSATRRQRLFMVRLPASIPYLFAALKLSACACVLAALVAEWLASDHGLGHLIVLYGTMYRTPSIWAAALLGTAMSLCVYGAVVLAEKLATPWRRGLPSTSN